MSQVVTQRNKKRLKGVEKWASKRKLIHFYYDHTSTEKREKVRRCQLPIISPNVSKQRQKSRFYMTFRGGDRRENVGNEIFIVLSPPKLSSFVRDCLRARFESEWGRCGINFYYYSYSIARAHVHTQVTPFLTAIEFQRSLTCYCGVGFHILPISQFSNDKTTFSEFFFFISNVDSI